MEIPFGRNPDGSEAAPLVFDEAVMSAGAQHTIRYVDRYSTAALVHLKWNGAGQAAALGDGFGFYSYNEMVDTHLAYTSAMTAIEQQGWSPDRAERAIGLVEAMVAKYRQLATPSPARQQ